MEGSPAAPWFLGLFIASISMTVGNKYVAVNYNYPNCMIFFQNSVAIVNLLIGEKLGFFKFKPFTTQQLLQVSVPSIFLSLQIMASLKALPYVAVATTVVFRNLATFSVAMAEKAFLKKSLSASQLHGLVVIVIGGIVYAWQDITFNAVGYFWLTFNCIIYTASSIYTKQIIARIDQTSDGTALLQQIGSLPFILLYAIIFNELPKGITDVLDLKILPFIVFVFLGFMGTLIALSYMNLYKRVSATSVAVASNINKVCSIFIAWFVFRKSLSSIQIFGLVVSIAGGLYYSFATDKAKKQAKEQKKAAAKIEMKESHA
eukprot:g13548.t1